MMIITKMTAEHTAQIAALEQLCFSSPWSENAIVYELTNPISFWLAAIENGQVIGYIGSQYGYGEADMMNLAVAPEHRRKGVANALVDALISQLANMDIHSLTLEVRASNVPAVSLYENMGFVQVGLRPNYYQKPKEAALILRKEW